MNNKRHILFEDWMTTKDFLVRRSFYEGTANERSTNGYPSMANESREQYERMDVNSEVLWETFKKWDTYTTCSKELFEYSLYGLKSIRI